MAIYRPIEIPEEQMSLPGASMTVDQIVNSLGYAFATTSYYTNGLAVLPALADIRDLVGIFAQEQTTPTHILLTGVSEGGLITTLATERYPETFDGGLAMCGPYGDFTEQVNHFGDPRVLFDYFFPGLIPGSPVDIPPSLMADWETSYYSSTILPVLEDPANAVSITQILQVLDVAPYAFSPPTSTNTLERLLWYNIYATNDAKTKLGGQPFDNADRVYSGSNDDAALNAGVARFSADVTATTEIENHYETTGVLTSPLVTLHTTGDPVVPYWQSLHYEGETIAADNIALHRRFVADRYGHCSFTSGEVLLAFSTLVDMVANPPDYEPVHRVYLPIMRHAP
jgi:pimeloyl-ACP methyl ester carboxylesterase